MRMLKHVSIAIFAVSFTITCGCSDGPGSDEHAEHDESAMVNSSHTHPVEGPHHGHLIELGNEDYHAELVHDQSAITIYILDATAKTAVAIDASEVTVNLRHGDKPEQFRLTAMPQDGDAEGKSSRFQSEDSHLASHLDEPGADARLNVTINGTPYSGAMAHSHGAHDHEDHKGHDHSHSDHEH